GQFESTEGRNRIESFVFADGTVWSAADVDLKTLQTQQTGGNDTVIGYTSQDVLDGGAGNDTLIGADSSDTYVFGRGYGQDVIHETYNTSGALADTLMFKADVEP